MIEQLPRDDITPEDDPSIDLEAIIGSDNAAALHDIEQHVTSTFGAQLMERSSLFETIQDGRRTGLVPTWTQSGMKQDKSDWEHD